VSKRGPNRFSRSLQKILSRKTLLGWGNVRARVTPKPYRRGGSLERRVDTSGQGKDWGTKKTKKVESEIKGTRRSKGGTQVNQTVDGKEFAVWQGMKRRETTSCKKMCRIL